MFGKTDDIDAAAVDQARAARVRAKEGRRGFLKNLALGVGGAGAALVGSKIIAPNSAAAQSANLDVAILQFALNLEYLEAEFYQRAAYGTGLSADQVSPNPGGVTGGSKVPFTSTTIAAYAQEIANEELKHVLFLRDVLHGLGQLVGEPAIDFTSSFPTLAAAAGLGANFNPFMNDQSFLLGAYVFEDVGVTAYHGAAPLITNKTYLDKAAGILAVEAYHAGIIRTVLFANGVVGATQQISNLRATLDGTAGTTNLDDYGVGKVSAPSLVVATDGINGQGIGTSNAIAYDRTTRQVLNIVYGAAGASKGLFYPNGMTGTITM